MRLAAPAMLVDINAHRRARLRAQPTHDGVRVGALARHAEVEADPDARRVQPLLAQALRLVAHPTIRNRGTTVGSIVHADPAAEMPAVLALLGGSVTAASTRRQAGRSPRPTSSSGRWSRRCGTTRSPSRRSSRRCAAGAGVAFEEVARRHGDYALCGVAALVRVADGEVVDGAGRLLLGLRRPDGRRPERRRSARRRTARRRPRWTTPPSSRSRSLDPADDIHATAAYRAPAGPDPDPSGRRGRARATPSRARSERVVTESLHDVRLTVNGVVARGRRCRPGGCSATRCATTCG